MTLYRRDGSLVWQMDFTVNGKRFQRSTKTKDKKLAEKIFNKVTTQIVEKKWFDIPLGADKPFSELIERYMEVSVRKAPMTHRRDKSLAAHVLRLLGDLGLCEVTASNLTGYKAARRKEGAAPQTIKNEVGLISRAINYGINELEWLSVNPVNKLPREKINNQRDRWLTREEEARLMAASPAWLREIIEFALNTGLRQSELLDLSWKQIDLARATLYIDVQKNKCKDLLPLSRRALEILSERAKVRHISTPLVFYSNAGTRISARNLMRAFYRTCKRAGIENLWFHDTRRTYGTRKAHAGVDPGKIRKLLRHKSPSMIDRYVIYNVDSLRDAVEATDVKSCDKSVTVTNFTDSAGG